MALMLVASNAMQVAEECPARLDLAMPMITRTEAGAANAYAACMTMPWLPLADQLMTKRDTCQAAVQPAVSPRLRAAKDWVDKMARNFAGCETQLTIRHR